MHQNMLQFSEGYRCCSSLMFFQQQVFKHGYLLKHGLKLMQFFRGNWFTQSVPFPTEGFRCGKCGKIFTSLNYLARHIKRVCPDMSCRKWKCNMCDKAFRHPFGLQQHIYTHTGERPHKCLQCPKAFYSSNDLRRHSRIHSGK